MANASSTDIGKAIAAGWIMTTAGIVAEIAITTTREIATNFQGTRMLDELNSKRFSSSGVRRVRPPAPARGMLNPLRPLRFLVADDNDGDVHWLRMVLDQAGAYCTLSIVSDGEQARDFLLRRGGYANAPEQDLIFLDLNLPKLTGIEVLRQVPGSARMPLCIITGSDAERKLLSREFGIRRIAYIVKPVDRMKILNCFRCYDHLRPLADTLST
jgi:CheY-like chemotaxis protein